MGLICHTWVRNWHQKRFDHNFFVSIYAFLPDRPRWICRWGVFSKKWPSNFSTHPCVNHGWDMWHHSKMGVWGRVDEMSDETQILLLFRWNCCLFHDHIESQWCGMYRNEEARRRFPWFYFIRDGPYAQVKSLLVEWYVPVPELISHQESIFPHLSRGRCLVVGVVGAGGRQSGFHRRVGSHTICACRNQRYYAYECYGPWRWFCSTAQVVWRWRIRYLCHGECLWHRSVYWYLWCKVLSGSISTWPKKV